MDMDEDNHMNENANKCLLTYLQATKQWGGGSQKTFLKPIHRIDQPCSGLLLWAKTSKAASRVARLWKQKQVEKTYLCLVPTDKLESLQRQSQPVDDNGNGNDNPQNQWWNLQGYQHRRLSAPSSDKVLGWNVKLTPEDPGPHEKARLVSATWRHVDLHIPPNVRQHGDHVGVILVRTNSGARHMIRALLAQRGQCPIHGDGRYGSQLRNEQHPRTVGLHAYSIQLPQELQLGSTTERYFEAPIPVAWEGALRSSGITRDLLQEALRELHPHT